MQPAIRLQTNLVNDYERRFLDWSCSRLPEQITPDHLTLFGIFGSFVVFSGYVAGRGDPHFLWLSVAGYVMHWLGDSLDGSLARFRGVQRPRYGYFLDHSVDAATMLVMIGGMGLSSYVRMDVALLVVIGHFALAIYVFLKNQVTGQFQLSFLVFGPTELRISFVAVTIAMIVEGPFDLAVGGATLSAYDVAMLCIAGTLLIFFVQSTAAMALRLRAAEGDGRRRPSLMRSDSPVRAPIASYASEVKDAPAR